MTLYDQGVQKERMNAMRIRVVAGIALTAVMLAVGCGDADEELTPEGRHFCESMGSRCPRRKRRMGQTVLPRGVLQPRLLGVF